MAKCVNDDSINKQEWFGVRVCVCVLQAAFVELQLSLLSSAVLSMLLTLLRVCFTTVAFLLAIFSAHILADECMRSHLPQLMSKYFKSDLNLFISNDVMWCGIIFLRVCVLSSFCTHIYVLLIHTLCSDKIFIYWIKFMYFVYITHSLTVAAVCAFMRTLQSLLSVVYMMETFSFCLHLLVANGRCFYSDIEIRTTILNVMCPTAVKQQRNVNKKKINWNEKNVSINCI